MAKVADRILVITDLLLGAAYADARLEGEEENAVRRLVSELLEGKPLPREVDERIKTFPAGTFDLRKTAEDFAADPPLAKRKLLELVAAVHGADEVLDMAEDEYLRGLAKALDMKESEYADLALDVEIDELREALDELRPKP